MSFLSNSDSGIQISTFVNAIMLTVVYTIAMGLGPSYFNQLKAAVSNCPSKQFYNLSYNQIYDRIILTLTIVVYSSVCGLILATNFFLFKPPVNQLRTPFGIYKERILLFIVFICTIISVVTSLLIYTYLMNYYLVPLDSTTCSYQTRSYWVPGTVSCGVSLLIAQYLMW